MPTDSEKLQVHLAIYENEAQHYRHLEDQRQKSISLFYGIAFAICAFLGAVRGEKTAHFVVPYDFLVVMLLFFFSVFGLFLYARVVKLQSAMYKRVAVMKKFRNDCGISWYDSTIEAAKKQEGYRPDSWLFRFFDKANYRSVSQLSRLSIAVPIMIANVISIAIYFSESHTMPPLVFLDFVQLGVTGVMLVIFVIIFQDLGHLQKVDYGGEGHKNPKDK